METTRIVGQSLYRFFGHLVFSTRDRRPQLTDPVGPHLHAYVAGICREMGSPVVVVGGMPDHVHILFWLPKEQSPVSLIRTVKTRSSVWLKTQGQEFADFAWQRGYGLFSVGPADLAAATKYIENQALHHRTSSFQDEFRQFLTKYGIDFDERYVWD